MVRQYYGAFYEVCELLGFHSVRHRFLDSVAYKAVQKRVFRRGIAPPALRGFALDGMESAAELFGLQTGTLYSLARFGQRLSEAVEATEIPDALEGLDFWADTAQALSLIHISFERKSRCRARAGTRRVGHGVSRGGAALRHP